MSELRLLKPLHLLNPLRLKFITWNVNGLDENERFQRTKKAISILAQMNADVIFLQEVVLDTFIQFASALVPMGYISPESENVENNFYFTCVFVKQQIAVYNCVRMEFDGPAVSFMGRDICRLDIEWNEMRIALFNCHLESMKECTDIRTAQMAQVIRQMRLCPYPAVLAGDLNARDAEIKRASNGTPLCDGYEYFGKPKELSKTWFLNNGNSPVGCRFDRVYHNCNPRIQFHKMQMIGRQKNAPSDHLGIYVEFQLGD